jgi:hypothetical protein
MRHPVPAIAFALIASGLLAGCDQLGIESASATLARTEADAKAVGSACRHAMRAIEDCYTLNPKAEKAAVYTGWREMDEYMRENKLEGVPPAVPRPDPAAKKKSAAAAEEVIDEPKDAPAKAHAKPAH